MFKSIRARLALSFAAIALVAAVALGAVLLTTLERYYSGREADYLKANGFLISTILGKMVSGGTSQAEVQSQVENFAFLSQARVRVYDAKKELVYDSGSPQKVEVALGALKQKLTPQPQPENGGAPSDVIGIISAGSKSGKLVQVQVKPGSDTSSAPDSKGIIVYRSIHVASSPFGIDLSAEADSGGARSNLTVKLPVQDPRNGSELGAVEMSEGPAYGRDILTSVAWGWALASAVAVLLAAAVGWYISRRISAPVLALTTVTTRMAQGELSSRADVESRDEFGQLARSFNEMADQVETTVTALRRFISDAAHELHTPLTALRTNLDLALDENNTTDRAIFLARAQALVKRLEELNNNLLDLSRLEANGHAARETVVDLTELLRQRGEVYASQAEQAGLVFEAELPPAPVLIRADASQVTRAMDNLVDNACKFTPQGGTVRVALSQQDGQVVFSVADTGIGIPTDDLPQLFNRFHRGRNATAFPGSGLGLAIVKAIVERQGGQVTAENTATGVRFSLGWRAANPAP